VRIDGPPQAGKPIRITAKHLGKPAVQVTGGPSPQRKPIEQDRTIIFRPEVSDGLMIPPGDLIAEITGPTAAVLAAERTAAALERKAAVIAQGRARAAGEIPPADRVAIEEELK
jgi:nicotinate-nucleotide pyrophosphorylase